jgi:hypothetical protein
MENKFIIYDNTPWEKQLLFQDLLKINFDNNSKIICTHNNLSYKNIENWKNINNINNIINNNIFIFSSNTSHLSDILIMVKFLKPNIIIHLSDEWGTKNDYQILSKYTKLLLRQYYHQHYNNYNNIFYLPCCYMDKMLENNYKEIKLKSPKDRKFKWSFVGNIKQDRLQMIITMKKINESYAGKASTEEMKNIYRDSIFVCHSKGNVTYDCSRPYEASICGAIPIIVCSNNEFETTFSKQENPPWLRYDSWEEAHDSCLELLKDMDKLETMSKKCFEWWNKRINNINNLILENL